MVGSSSFCMGREGCVPTHFVWDVKGVFQLIFYGMYNVCSCLFVWDVRVCSSSFCMGCKRCVPAHFVWDVMGVFQLIL